VKKSLSSMSWAARLTEVKRAREWHQVADLAVIGDEQLISRVVCVERHRNGISGIGFDVVVFEKLVEKHKYVTLWGIVFDESDFEEDKHTAVIDPKDPSSCWRGDNFEPFLRRIVAINCREEGEQS
jgi:hypothetical protein